MRNQISIKIIVLIFSTTWFSVALNSQDAQWLKHISGSFDDYASSVTTDSSGNVYVTGGLGAWNGPGGYVDGHFHTVSGTRDVFLAKFNAAGDYQWSVTAGGEKIPIDINEQEGSSFIRFNGVTNTVIVLGGYDSNSSYFGPGLSVSGKGMFLAGYSVEGVCLWLETVPWGRGAGLVIDVYGTIYVQCYREVIYNDRFLRKYSGNGLLIDSVEIGHEIGGFLTTQSDSVLVMAGWHRTGSDLFGIPIPTTATSVRMLLARIDTAMDQAIDIKPFYSSGLATFGSVNQSGNELITSGVFQDSLIFGNDTIISPPGAYQPFIAKHDYAGDPVWLQWFNASSAHYTLPRAVIANDGSIYVTFSIASTVTLGSFTVTPITNEDFVLARFDEDGNCIGVIQSGEVSTAHINLSCTSDGGVLVCGVFRNTLQLGDGLISQGADDGFVAKFNAITGIQSFGDLGNDQLHIYANPNNGICTVDLPSSISPGSDLMLTIYNAQGQLVQQAPLIVSNGTVQLDIQAQAKGVYMVELLDGSQRYSGTIVFE
ncbi:MAG: T9SS type A sorting domain-containing protein [Flavobacteriales bacterium]|nr:T9SS type A sorting domain-containing protein [Flavobacteriales bacterium]